MKFPFQYRQSTRNLFPLIMLGLCGLTLATPLPIVELKFNEGSGTTLTNTGTAGGNATKASSIPIWSTNTYINGGTHALDYGTVSSVNNYVDFANTTGLKNLKSFTIMGWVNARSSNTIGGGNRIVTFNSNGTNDNHGVDLSMRSEGSLAIGINEWSNGANGKSSSSGKITVDSNASFNNWTFFVVTFDITLTSGQVKFYFGTNSKTAELDAVHTLANPVAVGANISPTLSIGSHAPSARACQANAVSQMFRGLIDNIAIYGSTTNGSGALNLSEITALQQSAPLAGVPGLLYEQWDNIPGTTIAELENNSRYPNSPSATLVRPTFDGFQNRGDNFGARLSGWIKAPETGDYTFWIACNNNGVLRLSPDFDPDKKIKIAEVTDYTNYLEWNKSTQTSQKSALIHLVQDQYYYIEALVKEATNADHLSVGWQIPSGTLERPIPSSRLSPSATPDANVAVTFPDYLNLYEKGTSIRKATLGWSSEIGNAHFSIKTNSIEQLKIYDQFVNVNSDLVFGPEFGSTNKNVTLKWVPPADGNASGGLLFQYGPQKRMAMQIKGPSSASGSQPTVEINQEINISGEGYLDTNNQLVSGDSYLHYLDGLSFTKSFKEKNLVSPGGVQTYYTTDETSQFNGNRLFLEKDLTNTDIVGVIKNNVSLNSEKLFFTSILGPTQKTTTLSADKLSTDEVHANYIETGTIKAVTMVTTPKWQVIPDFVFQKGYRLSSLAETESFVQKNKHLPNIPSAQEISTKGMDLTEMNLKLLKTMEEMTLHLIALNKNVAKQGRQIQAQNAKNKRLEKELQTLKNGSK